MKRTWTVINMRKASNRQFTIQLTKLTLFAMLVLIGGLANAQTINSQSGGTFTSGGNWVGGSAPTLTHWAAQTAVINSGHAMTLTNDTWGGSAAIQTLRVKNGGSLTISGTLTTKANVDIIVEAGGTLTINNYSVFTGASQVDWDIDGQVDITGSGMQLGNGHDLDVAAGATLNVNGTLQATNSPSIVTINGTLDVGGNYDITTSGVTHTWNGDIDIGGFFEVSANTNVSMTGGTADIVGTVRLNTNGVMTGTGGVMTNGGYVIGSCGFSYLICGANNWGSGCAATGAPPAGGVDFSTCAAPCPTPTVGGSVASAATVCSGANGATLTLSGHTGTVNNWQKNENGGGWVDVANATNTLVYSNITVTTQYRAQVQNGGSCAEENSADVTITVDDATVGGSITTAATVCTGSNGATLTLAGHTGSITKWQQNVNGGGWSDIANTTTTQAYANITQTTQWRAVVQSGVCAAANSADVTITVDEESVGGSITTAASVCNGDHGPTTLTLAGHTGTITKWQYSTDNWVTPNDIVNGTTTQDYEDLTTTTKYRAVVTNGVCASANSADVTITVYDVLTSGTIASAQTISHGGTPNTLTESVAATGGGGGYTYQWQSSTTSAVAGFANIGGATAATYSPGALTQTTWYRRIATTGCGSETSNAIEITVNMYVCSGSSPSAISSGSAASGGGGGGPTYQWEISTTSSAAGFSDIGGETGATLSSPPSVTQDTWYRRKVTIDGCVGYSNVLKASISSGNPGGIGGSVVWLKADAGTGSINTQWEDQSGNNNHYTTVGTPTVSSGDSTSNYNTFIELTASEGFDAPAGAALGSQHTIFVVARKTSANGRILDGHTGDYAWGHDGSYGKSLNVNGNPNNGTSSPATTQSAQVKMLQTFVRNSSGTYVHRVDGEQIGSYSSAADPSSIQVDINTGAGASSSCLVHELIIYNSALSSSDIEIIESYLMTKYGLGTNNNAYKTSLGGTAYNIASYDNDIIGIGKECYFNQKQSGAEDDSVRIWVSNGAWAATNAAHTGSISNDVSYVMVGHDNGALTATPAANADKPASINNRIEREWKITNTNFDDDFTIEIEWDSSGSFDLSDIRLLVDDDGDFTSGASVYASGDQGMTFALGSIIIKGIPTAVIPAGGTKIITIGATAATTLPVELTAFDAEKLNETVDLTWETASEINNDYFEIQKSTDGENWHVIGTAEGAGNSVEISEYTFTDYDGCQSICYYRLKQVDFDGTYDFSDIKVVGTPSDNLTNLSIYPVPVGELATVQFQAVQSGLYDVEVISLTSSSIFNTKLVCVEGSNSFDLNTSGYSPGMYYLIVRDNQGKVVNKINFTK